MIRVSWPLGRFGGTTEDAPIKATTSCLHRSAGRVGIRMATGTYSPDANQGVFCITSPSSGRCADMAYLGKLIFWFFVV
ncbi:hypothetical protein MCOR02_005797 [Pyricularia oryzae]|uniref:Uncharacterized protein n=2 Tax=Pyricularia TaxID=48558 RepID=A0ABQ8P050_PYRGI|nr:hypothetical protein MCOR02_005797 [Pyricularia oryzae]KAI6304608.1 hypothetical protein MCOR33_000459 [Pyricularia grisea]KAI6260174.1 hypothetical protein MCOR19_003490 [Pyricularia oryzae]KAI6334369.1 hypothetical protein MCOR29_000683 [Pyricularia oryzae]KAI6341829.1 hypothetical protein MCOR28_005778 [Pyricularia oryzae]